METELARAFSELFAPEYFVLFCTVSLLVFEWRSRGRADRLLSRVGVVGAAWALAFAVYQATPLLFEPVPPWGEDLVGGLGLAFGFSVIWAAWRRRRWGPLVPEFATLLISLTVLHSVIVPFWDISGHVIYTTAPSGYLSFVDRRFAPLLVVAVGMVASRPLAGAHTWLQSIAGFAVAGAFVLGLVWKHARSETAAEDRLATRPLEKL